MGFQSKRKRILLLLSQRKEGLRKGNEGFTLVQVMTAFGILLILASIAGFAYTSILDDARASVCKTNLETLNTAVELYGQEYGAIPATLGELKLKHLEKAYAQVMGSSSWYRKFSHAFLKMNLSDEAYAEFLTYDNLKRFGAAKDSFRCPEDDNGGTSYGINANLAGTLWPKVGDDVVVVGDCDSDTFTSAAQLRKRHGSGKVAIATTKGGTVVELGDDAASDTDGVVPNFDVVEDGRADIDYDGIVAEYVTKLNDYVSGLDLPTGVESSYIGNLGNVTSFAQSGNINSASNELEAFIAKVEGDMSDSIISEAAGNDLISVANNFMAELRN
jgi:type II secretory pathway pseudopilin PulG